MADETIIKTGNASFGKEFKYKLADIRYTNNNGFCNLLDFIYITANGLVTLNLWENIETWIELIWGLYMKLI